MQQQTKKTGNQQQSAKPQAGQPNNGSNVWDFNQFKQGTEAWNSAWNEMLAHNANSEKWTQTYNQGNKNFGGWMNSWNQFTNTASDATSEYYQAFGQKCTQWQSQWYNYTNECSAMNNKTYGQYNQMFQNAFNWKTYDQCISWSEGCAIATQKIWGEYCANGAQNALDCQESLYQPMMKQVFNWQDRCWKAWAKYAKNACNWG